MIPPPVLLASYYSVSWIIRPYDRYAFAMNIWPLKPPTSPDEPGRKNGLCVSIRWQEPVEDLQPFIEHRYWPVSIRNQSHLQPPRSAAENDSDHSRVGCRRKGCDLYIERQMVLQEGSDPHEIHRPDLTRLRKDYYISIKAFTGRAHTVGFLPVLNQIARARCSVKVIPKAHSFLFWGISWQTLA